MDKPPDLKQHDGWLQDDSPAAALVMRQWLLPVEGREAVIFPPTYAAPAATPKEEWLGYNIDRFDNGTTVCQIDSVGAQANRMEPIFKREPYRALVPQICVKAGEVQTSILDAGHRAADAMVRHSELHDELEEAFRAWQKDGNAVPLAKVAPTSFVFGAFDSRATRARAPRIVRSVVRAFGAEVLHRSATFIPPVEYVREGILDEPGGKAQQDAMSEQGFAHVPATWKHGGVIVHGEIRRDAAINLVALRALGGPKQGGDPLPVRRYVLGLSLVAFTAPQETFLREGCQLVPDTEHASEWRMVRHDGEHDQLDVAHEQALGYATAAAQAFGVGESRTVNFNSASAKKAMEGSKQERKAARRRGRAGGRTEGSDT